MSKARCATVLLVLVFLMTPVAAYAVPNLTLFIPEEYGGSYNTTTETWITSLDDFILQAMVDDRDVFRGADDVDLYLCISLLPELYTYNPEAPLPEQIMFVDDLNTTISAGINTFELNADDFMYGTPPSTAFNLKDGSSYLPPHGIFPTAYREVSFNIEDPGTYEFLINDAVAGMHFDLYTITTIGSLDYFAPFSHDAEVTPPVPEPATAALLGSGLLLLPAGMYFRKKRSKKESQ